MRRRAALPVAIAALALAVAPASASAGRADHGSGSMQRIGRTLLSAIDTAGGDSAVREAIDHSLALLGARYKLEHLPAPSSRPAPRASSPAPVTDPAKMPPASAGSNGTAVPRAASAEAGQLFAHSRSGDPASAILLTGVALAPPDAPEAVQGAIDAANTIVGRPYVWGGGHGSFYSRGYDCSGAVSFALFGGGLIPEPLNSVGLEHWGAPGPGRWITVYANAEHAFAEIAGLRWDTVGDASGTGPRWHLAPADTSGFVARHPPGL